MKIIHCADLHLDSKLDAHLDKIKAKQRRNEILNSFVRMVHYAAENKVEAIIIAGDLFDKKNVASGVKDTVIATIEAHPDITFYYLKGNHDDKTDCFDDVLCPVNLKRFTDHWVSYPAENKMPVMFTGIEFSENNRGNLYSTLVLDEDMFNIVIMHGQESDSLSGDKTDIVNLKALRNRGINYLALGHIHKYKMEQLDAGAVYCYPGCLDGRGFDECGEHGFVLLDVQDDKRFTSQFVSFASRTIYEIPVDVSDCLTTADVIRNINDISSCMSLPETAMVRFILSGDVTEQFNVDTDFIGTHFEGAFFYVSCLDKTMTRIDPKMYAGDKSLKGEFVRSVLEDTKLSEQEQSDIIMLGLNALKGDVLL